MGELRLEHAGRRARVDGREGRLMYARVPAYSRIDVRCWYLVTESGHPRFGEHAVSLQWATAEPVELLSASPAAAA